MATENHADALKALDQIEKILSRPKALTLAPEDLCKTYAKLRPFLITALKLIKLIPIYGSKIAAAVEFLMKLADQLCAV